MKITKRKPIRKAKSENTKEPMPTSKKVLWFSLTFCVAAWTANFILAWLGKQQVSDVTMAAVYVFGGFVTTDYFALSGFRNGSINKVEQARVKAGDFSRKFNGSGWVDAIGDEERGGDPIGD